MGAKRELEREAILFMSEKKVVLNGMAIHRMLSRIAHEILEQNDDSKEIVLVGIQRGGVQLAERLAVLLQSICGHPVLMGHMDICMHRDDLDKQLPPPVHPTVIPCDITGKTIVLVDDVLHSGRTTRAALDALNDFGRPRRIQLAVLIDRGCRELPIKADFVGKRVEAHPKERITVQLKEESGEDTVFVETV